MGLRTSTGYEGLGAIIRLEVVMMDGDQVSETNCVRQPFSTSDIGQNKATVLINRINLFWERYGARSPRISMNGHSTGSMTLLSIY